MQTSANKYGVQMELPLAAEWTRAGLVWCGAEVFQAAKRPSEAREQAEIRRITRCNRGISLAEVIGELNRKLSGGSTTFAPHR